MIHRLYYEATKRKRKRKNGLIKGDVEDKETVGIGDVRRTRTFEVRNFPLIFSALLRSDYEA